MKYPGAIIPLGLSPQGIPKKEIIPAIIGAVAAIAGGAIAASASNSASKKAEEAQRQANEANIQLQREQNQFAHQMYREQFADQKRLIQQTRDWSLQDRDYENQYNSPFQQVQRYREAGLNPYLMMSGQNAVGSVSAESPSGSAPSASIPQAAHVQPYNYALQAQVGQYLGQSFNTAMQNFADVAFRKEDQKIQWVNAVKDLPIPNDEKIQLIRTGLFDASKNSPQYELYLENLKQESYKTIMAQVSMGFQQELNDEQRRQFDRNKERHIREMNELLARYNELLSSKELNVASKNYTVESQKLLEQELKQIGRYETLPEWAKTLVSIISEVGRDFAPFLKLLGRK